MLRPSALLFLLLAWTPVHAGSEAPDGGPTWVLDLSCGYDSFTHTYALATADTSETVAEARVAAGWEGRSAADARSAWRLRLDGSAGTDLWREGLEADWRRRDPRGVDRLRATARLAARQYREGSDYSRSSDLAEGRLEALAVPWAGERREAFVTTWGSASDYAAPSSLEQDLKEVGLGVGLRSRHTMLSTWRLSVRHAARTYPDSTSINRRSWCAEADWTGALGLEGLGRVFARSERRLAADPAVRPDAWLHWLDAAIEAPAPGGDVVVELQAERWDYAEDSETWLDSWRLSGYAGLRRGDVLAGQWQLGLAGEKYHCTSEAESYGQAGVRAGVEAFGERWSGSCSVEYGRRDYGTQPAEVDPESLATWTDFNYWRLWLLADWRLSGTLALSALANWEPERHAEPQDDVALGYASVRLVWRR